MKKNQLELFGEMLIVNVRDESIDYWERVVEGKLKSERAQNIHKQLIGNFNALQLDIISSLISQVVDTTLHNLLCLVEQEDSVDIVFRSDVVETNIKELSDGLAGELYTDDGWILKYSKKKFIEP